MKIPFGTKRKAKMKAQEAVDKWAVKTLKEKGIDYDEDKDIISVREEKEYDGYCETCWSDWDAVNIYVNREKVWSYNGSMYSLMDELIEIATEGR